MTRRQAGWVSALCVFVCVYPLATTIERSPDTLPHMTEVDYRERVGVWSCMRRDSLTEGIMCHSSR